MILVTGSTGFIGRNLTPRLIASGEEVRVLAHNPALAGKLFPGAAVAEGDLLDRGSIKAAMKGVSRVIHLAGLIDYKDRKRLFETNYQGTKNLLEFCGGVDKIVFSSSVAVFGKVEGKAGDRTVPHPDEPYGESKMMAEKLVTDSGIKSAVLRLAPIYGEGSPWFGHFLKMLSWGIPCPRTESMVQLVHISDAVRGIELAMKRGSGRFIIADEKPVRLMHVTEKLVGFLGRRYWTVPKWMIELPAGLLGMGSLVSLLMENRVYDISRSKKVLGFRPAADMDLELKRMVEWYLAHRGSEGEH
ncbi:MAG TPA: NAD-dependent epimerase/dehydratase family protein [Candidatus Saccharimonadales bacterium]|nr:NAD-dependent epimerase/dehydratase family protein [Candidatus Saccharimonadales bacterium]